MIVQTRPSEVSTVAEGNGQASVGADVPNVKTSSVTNHSNHIGNGISSIDGSSAITLAPTTAAKDFHVSVIGAGLGGAALGVGLHREGVPFDIFESASQIAEIGAGIGVGANARNALKKLGLGEMFEKLASYSPEKIYFQWRLGEGEEQTNFAHTADAPNGNSSVHRAEFLDGLLEHFPSERCHLNKRLENITALDGAAPRKLRLHFEDGTTSDTDVVIGCDGIHSRVRTFLDPDKSGSAVSSETNPFVWSGTWAYRGLVPLEQFKKTLGTDKGLLYGLTPQMFLGRDAHILMFPIQHCETVNIVAFRTDRSNWPKRAVLPEGTPWTIKTSQADMLADFPGWGSDLHAILKLIPQPAKWALHTIKPNLASYVNKTICVAGDAAHGGCPHLGALAGQAFEDALFYSRILGLPDVNRTNVENVMSVIDVIRLPRGNAIMEASLRAGDVYEFADSEMGDDIEKLAAHLPVAWRPVWDHDHDEEFEAGLTWLRTQGVIPEEQPQ